MQHSDALIVQKIIKEIDFASNRLEHVSPDEFMTDEDAQHSVGMAAINVGELIKHISEELRESFPNVPWKQAAGLRDVTAHSYDTIRMDDLYITIKEDFPQLRELLKELQ